MTANSRYLIALLTPLCVLLATPPNGLYWIVFIWNVPWLIALTDAPLRSRFAITLATGLGLWCLALWWLVPAVMAFSGASVVLALALFVLLCVVQTIPMLLFVWLDAIRWGYRTDKNAQNSASLGHVARRIVLRALYFSVLTTWLPLLIPATPLVALYQHPDLLGWLSIGGLPLMTFVFALMQMSLLEIWNSRGQHKHQAVSLGMLLLAGVLVGLPAVGAFPRSPDATHIRIGAVQPDLDRRSNTAMLFDMSDQLLRSNPVDLLVWPEFPAPFSATDNAEDAAALAAFESSYPVPLMLVSGYVYADTNNHDGGYYNAAQWFQAGVLQQSYYKQRLVPFFEYVPAGVSKDLLPNAAEYKHGSEFQLFDVKPGVRVIPLICYEMLFDDMVKTFVEQGGNLIVNPTSDTWFGDSPGPFYHFALAVFQVVESGIPMVRVANSGISAVVLPSGEIYHQTGLMTPASMVDNVPIPEHPSWHFRYGWILTLLMQGLLLVDFVRRLIQPRRLNS
ncbi:Apolipoprotein N-acyltransferase [BD1-7 clade bacterium]|uniref:Apolipoprotein N-acyltransferase n=1 Tax=BD1-7 clade bacterium TaxID=2029982 RepID=A0A5S9NUI5_9GAMM|nr:Apolipoprotein N-acyltransferase [BD1-7 clade bacterium]CAA0109607.1 Apolipoprotein N-acyltransferase [BD1-7 clade bacterium]